MALGTWQVFKDGAFVTLDLTDRAHQMVLSEDLVILRDTGLDNAAIQNTAVLPFSGEYQLIAAPVNVATLTAGTLLPAVRDPSDSAKTCPLAGGAGSIVVAGTVTSVSGANRAMIYRGTVPPGMNINASSVATTGTAHLLLFARRLPKAA